MGDLAVYAGLFLAALLAVTILPAQSEAPVVALILNDYAPWLVLTVASVGNAAGSFLNWLLGRGIEQFRDLRWFLTGPAALARAESWYRRYGKWSLVLARVADCWRSTDRHSGCSA